MGEAKRRKQVNSNFGKSLKSTQREKEHPNIAARDWRLHAITTVTDDAIMPDGQILSAGSVLELAGFVQLDKKTYSFPVPNPIALYLSLAKSAGIRGKSARTMLKQTKLAGDKQFRQLEEQDEVIFFDSIKQLVACVIFSYSALEVFANLSFPDDFVHRRSRQDGRCIEEFSRDQIERHLSLSEKYNSLLPNLFRVSSPKGTKLWDRFVRLQRLRDRFIHLKADDWKSVSSLDNSNTIWTELLAADVPCIYQTSIDLIEYFSGTENSQRWFWKMQSVTQANSE